MKTWFHVLTTQVPIFILFVTTRTLFYSSTTEIQLPLGFEFHVICTKLFAKKCGYKNAHVCYISLAKKIDSILYGKWSHSKY